MRNTVRFLTLIAVAAMLYVLFKEASFFSSFRNIFKSNSVKIENTAVVVQEIRSIAELVTITFSDEVVMTKTKRGKGFPSLVTTGSGIMMMPDYDKLVIIGKGKAFAGIDFDKLDSSMIFVQNDSIAVSLPPVEILSTIVNPSGFEIFVEDGNWREDEIIDLKNNLKKQLALRAVEQNVLKLAGTRAEVVLASFLKTLGYKMVNITVN